MTNVATIRAIAKELPGIRTLRHAPPYFTGSVLANRLGYQVLRTTGKHFLWTIRGAELPAAAAGAVEAVLRDGVVAIPDFLPAEEFARVRQEYEQVRPELTFQPLPVYSNLTKVERGRIHAATTSVTDAPKRFPNMMRSLVDNPLLAAIVAGIVRVRAHGRPSASIDVYQKRDETAPDNDVETVLHADLHSTTVKAFFYLNDVDERNGAFVYAKGSARVTWSRLKHEYDISVRSARLKRGDADMGPDLLAVRGPNQRNMVRPRYLKEMQIQESSICGKANTLIIANNLGFHRRGDFSSEEERATVLLNFRHLQRPFWS